MKRYEYKTIRFELKAKAITTEIERNEVIGKEKKSTTNFFGIAKESEEPIFKKTKKTVVTGHSETEQDTKDLQDRMNIVLNKFAEEGWRVMSIQPILKGKFKKDTFRDNEGMFAREDYGAGWGYGYGYSVTDCVLVTLEREVLGM